MEHTGNERLSIRIYREAKALGRSMLEGFAASNTTREFPGPDAVLLTEAVMNGEFPLVSTLIAQAELPTEDSV